MKPFCLLILLSIIFVSCKENSLQRPNIIFILADDYGIVDTQGYATKFLNTSADSTFYETPNIDLLMKEGVSFSQAYANQLCSPTRASIITGKYASKLGFTTAMPHRRTYYNQNLETPKGYYVNDVLEHKDNILIEQPHINGISNSAVPTGSHAQANVDELSIAEALKDYYAAFIGKWHIGGFGAKGFQPQDNGFEALAYFDAGGSPYYNWKNFWNEKAKGRFPNMPQKEWMVGKLGEETNEKYLTDDLTKQALMYIEEKVKDKDKPFFLYLSHFAVHSPYQGKKAEVDYFNSKKTKGFNGQKDPIYASMIKSMDRSVGQILAKLKSLHIEENTLVIFMSDNGGIDAEITPNGKGTENYPFLGGKACLTEGGIRVPLIFKWKGKIESGKWVDTAVDCTDIFPTILEAAGYNAKKIIAENNLDGESVIGLLSDTKNDNKSYQKNTHYWHYPFNVIYKSPFDGFPLTPHSAIRKGDFKLIFDWYGRLYLYDLKKDPFENNNLYVIQKEKGDLLFKELVTWLANNVEKRYWPKINPKYNPEKEVRPTAFKDLIGEMGISY